jgi:polysaccharide biosynthesis/export protein
MNWRHRLCAVCAAAALVGAPGVRAQAEGTQAGPMKASVPDDYRIGEGDVLSVSIVDAPEFSGKFRVSDSGFIQVPGTARPIHAEGQTAFELSGTIADDLVSAKQLRSPRVTVFVDEYHGRTVTVLGAVAKPGVYPLERKTTVVEALSMANGLSSNAGSTVTIVRGPASAEATGEPAGSVQILDLNRLVKGSDLSANVEVRKGDIISVSNAEVVYVVGAVTKPGGFVLPDPASGMSVVQALAMAEGFSRLAATHHGLILRASTSATARQLVPVDVGQLLTGKEADMRLAPNDILYIPESSAKKTLKVMGDIAMAAINGVAIYGLGYRLAGGAP